MIDLTKKRDEAEEGNDDVEKFGSKIEGLKTPPPPQNDEEDSESEKKAKPRPFNHASIAAIEQKREKISKIRKNKGDLIKAQPLLPSEQINNVFTAQTNPDTLTMSLYNRPMTSQNSQSSITGLYPSKS